MPSTRELRRRIRSVKNTSQITKAMQMVAATKMRRAQTQALAGRPYNEALNQALSRLVSRIDTSTHPLLNINSGTGIATVLLSTDKSLCGALNTNLFRVIQNSKEAQGDFYTVGSKGKNFVIKTGKKLGAEFENPEKVSFHQAVVISRLLIDAFTKGKIKEAYIAFPRFVSTLRQEPTIAKLLPIDPAIIAIKPNAGHPEAALSTGKQIRPSGESAAREYLFEPSPAELLDYVLTHYLEVQVYQALVETKASEWSARMMAMQNATDNAKELVDDLNLTYNQTRQNNITQELLEITTAGLALQ